MQDLNEQTLFTRPDSPLLKNAPPAQSSKHSGGGLLITAIVALTVVLALVFGLFHIATYTASFHRDPLAGIALALVGPTLVGLCFAIIVLRTRNLFASSVIHVLLDTCSIFAFA